MKIVLWLALVAAVAVLCLYLRGWGYYPDDDLLGK